MVWESGRGGWDARRGKVRGQFSEIESRLTASRKASVHGSQQHSFACCRLPPLAAAWAVQCNRMQAGKLSGSESGGALPNVEGKWREAGLLAECPS